MNDYPYRINLAGPWDYQPLAHTILHAVGSITTVKRPLPPAGKMTMPCRWADGGLGAFNGRVRFRRVFHWPGKLDYYERLWLVFGAADYFATVWLNGEELGRHEGAFDAFEFEVTPQIRLRNELVVEVDLPEAPHAPQRMFRGRLPSSSGGLWSAVGVEVRRETFFRNISCWAALDERGSSPPTVHVCGEVFGNVDRPLELYVLLNGRTVVYQNVAAGQPFEVSAHADGLKPWQPGTPFAEIQIDLVDVAAKLDAVRMPIGLSQSNKNAVVIDLDKPLLELGKANWMHDKVVHVRLPIPAAAFVDPLTQGEARRQLQVIVRTLRHHPAILGWIVSDADDKLLAELRSVDPVRNRAH